MVGRWDGFLSYSFMLKDFKSRLCWRIASVSVTLNPICEENTPIGITKPKDFGGMIVRHTSSSQCKFFGSFFYLKNIFCEMSCIAGRDL